MRTLSIYSYIWVRRIRAEHALRFTRSIKIRWWHCKCAFSKCTGFEVSKYFKQNCWFTKNANPTSESSDVKWFSGCGPNDVNDTHKFAHKCCVWVSAPKIYLERLDDINSDYNCINMKYLFVPYSNNLTSYYGRWSRHASQFYTSSVFPWLVSNIRNRCVFCVRRQSICPKHVYKSDTFETHAKFHTDKVVSTNQLKIPIGLIVCYLMAFSTQNLTTEKISFIAK